jgi:acylphosphatase
MPKHFSITVSGKVQGVFFRAFAKEKADELDITGFARNEPTGQVYIEAEGEEEFLNTFINWCRQGPRLSSVTSLTVNEGELKHFREFTITR